MAPNIKENKHKAAPDLDPQYYELPKVSPRKYEIKYFNVLLFSSMYVSGLYGLYLAITSAKWATIAMNFFFYIMSMLGITAAAHRHWAHKSFKAKAPLEIILLIFNSISYHNTATDWVLKHRLHHKYVDTDADPHNAARGFFYSHIGWLLVKRHPQVRAKEKNIDMSDIYNNPYLKFQKKYAIPIFGFFCFFLPTFIPMYFWDESYKNAAFVNLFRWTFCLNSAFCVNSIAHIWGYRPYDKRMLATQNYFANTLTVGEGSHNYHHAFPYDYRSNEIGFKMFNFPKSLIDFFARIGWAYDLKFASQEIVQKTAASLGDGSFRATGDADEKNDSVELNPANKVL